MTRNGTEWFGGFKAGDAVSDGYGRKYHVIAMKDVDFVPKESVPVREDGDTSTCFSVVHSSAIKAI